MRTEGEVREMIAVMEFSARTASQLGGSRAVSDVIFAASKATAAILEWITGAPDAQLDGMIADYRAYKAALDEEQGV